MRSRVQDVMISESLNFLADDDVDVAMGKLLAAGASAAAVVGREGRLVGLVSALDLLLHHHGATVGERMTSPAFAVGAADSLQAAARALSEAGVPRAVVVDPQGHPVGMLPATVALRALTGLPPARSRETSLEWSESAPLELSSVSRAPDGPGVLVLLDGETELRTEWCLNVRTRIYELLGPARVIPAPARLRFRTAATGAEPRRAA